MDIKFIINYDHPNKMEDSSPYFIGKQLIQCSPELQELESLLLLTIFTLEMSWILKNMIKVLYISINIY